MQTTLDCLPCFLKQSLHTARLSTSSTGLQEEILRQVSRLLAELDFSLSPPENAVGVYGLIAELSGCPDPYAGLKRKSNRYAIKMRAGIERKIRESRDPLLAALKFSIAGNIIDYGSLHAYDMEKTIEDGLTPELAIDHYEEFRADLDRAGTILFLGDNSGELVFDGLLIREMGKKTVFSVKEKAIINDALLADARECGLKGFATLISNGTGCPGTPLAGCSRQFRDAFSRADLIISKGQGNFETLSETRAPIYFLLTAKCPVVAAHVVTLARAPEDLACALPFPVLLRSPRFGR